MRTPDLPRDHLRLANLLAALSLETDLAMGHPPEEAMRTCLLATSIGRRIGLAEAEVADVYWTSLLMHVGCTAYAHEQALLFGGDEIAVNAAGSKIDDARPAELLAFLREVGDGQKPLERARMMLGALIGGARFSREVAAATCEVGAMASRRLGLADSVRNGLLTLFERWDGKGQPGKLAGDAIPLSVRLAQLAAQAMVFHRIGGTDAAVGVVQSRAGTALDPHLCAAFSREAEDVLAEVHSGDPFTQVVQAEPAPQRSIPVEGLDEVARTFGDLVDLKSPFTLEHSRGVARLAEAAGRTLGMSDDDVVCLRRCGHLHDLGRASVPNGIWEKPGPLTAAEWERVRLHPYHSERILARSPVLAPLAPIVGMHHERLDGSGYYRQATAGSIPLTARVLAVADKYQGLTEDRAHRAALSADDAANRLQSEAREGRLDARAVDAVLAAAGIARSRPVRQGWPCDLTDREVDVLRLLARGTPNREIGRRLYISPKTVGRHVENIYRKLDISSRASAALFAAHHDLLATSTAETD